MSIQTENRLRSLLKRIHSQAPLSPSLVDLAEGASEWSNRVCQEELDRWVARANGANADVLAAAKDVADAAGKLRMGTGFRTAFTPDELCASAEAHLDAAERGERIAGAV